MATDLGEYVVRSIVLTDANGVAVDADALPTYTVTLPDGTAGIPPTVLHGVVGEYYVNYLPTQAGRLEDVFTATVAGLTVKFGPDTFHVRAATGAPIVSLADIRRHIGLTAPDPVRDEQLRDFIESATSMVEKRTTKVYRRQTVVETYNGGVLQLALRTLPVISVTSIAQNGVNVTDYVLDPVAGLISRGTIYASQWWLPGLQNVTVTYVAGATSVPVAVQGTVKELVRYLWDSQRGGSGLPRQNGADEFDPRNVESILRDNLARESADVF